jgi:hypothetical protein
MIFFDTNIKRISPCSMISTEGNTCNNTWNIVTKDLEYHQLGIPLSYNFESLIIELTSIKSDLAIV